jgi:hypothetical protein
MDMKSKKNSWAMMAMALLALASCRATQQLPYEGTDKLVNWEHPITIVDTFPELRGEFEDFATAAHDLDIMITYHQVALVRAGYCIRLTIQEGEVTMWKTGQNGNRRQLELTQQEKIMVQAWAEFPERGDYLQQEASIATDSGSYYAFIKTNGEKKLSYASYFGGWITNLKREYRDLLGNTYHLLDFVESKTR